MRKVTTNKDTSKIVMLVNSVATILATILLFAQTNIIIKTFRKNTYKNKAWHKNHAIFRYTIIFDICQITS
jgi:hypothetical protein